MTRRSNKLDLLKINKVKGRNNKGNKSNRM